MIKKKNYNIFLSEGTKVFKKFNLEKIKEICLVLIGIVNIISKGIVNTLESYIEKLNFTRLSLLSFFILAIFYILLFGYGIYNSYSGVIKYDGWDFYHYWLEWLPQKPWMWFFFQHNEHISVITRFVVLIDNYLFSGKYVFGLLLNFLFPIFNFLILYYLLIKKLNIKNQILILFCLVFSLSWCQYFNLMHHLQTALIWVVTFATLSIYFFVNSENKINLYFYLALFFGICCTFSMANGLLIWFVLLLVAILRRYHINLIIFLSLITITVFLFYFNVTDLALENRVAKKTFSNLIINFEIKYLIKYFLHYLSSPFFHIFGKGAFEHTSYRLAGIFFIISFLLITLKIINFKELKINKFFFFNKAVLISYSILVFSILSGMMVTIGRAAEGLPHGFESKFTSPMIVAWIVLFILLTVFIKIKIFNLILNFFLIISIIFAFSYQLYFVIFSNYLETSRFESKVGALAYSMRLPDLDFTNKVRWNQKHSLYLSQKFIYKQKYSIYSHFPYNLTIDLNGNELEHVPYWRDYKNLTNKEILFNLDENKSIKKLDNVKDKVKISKCNLQLSEIKELKFENGTFYRITGTYIDKKSKFPYLIFEDDFYKGAVINDERNDNFIGYIFAPLNFKKNENIQCASKKNV